MSKKVRRANLMSNSEISGLCVWGEALSIYPTNVVLHIINHDRAAPQLARRDRGCHSGFRLKRYGQAVELAGTKTLVTSGNKGIRHPIVEELAGFGARMYACSRSRRWLEKGLRVTVSACRRRRACTTGEAHGHRQRHLR